MVSQMEPIANVSVSIPWTSGPAFDPTIRIYVVLASVAAALVAAGCGDSEQRRVMEVSASAYNSVPEQTHPDHPTTAAWGDELEPGMRAIAVSRDLLEEGLTVGVEVEIDALDGTWVVLDVMHPRWERSIDIYMGEDIERAREWGRQDVTIRWQDEGA